MQGLRRVIGIAVLLLMVAAALYHSCVADELIPLNVESTQLTIRTEGGGANASLRPSLQDEAQPDARRPAKVQNRSADQPVDRVVRGVVMSVIGVPVREGLARAKLVAEANHAAQFQRLVLADIVGGVFEMQLTGGVWSVECTAEGYWDARSELVLSSHYNQTEMQMSMIPRQLVGVHCSIDGLLDSERELSAGPSASERRREHLKFAVHEAPIAPDTPTLMPKTSSTAVPVSRFGESVRCCSPAGSPNSLSAVLTRPNAPRFWVSALYGGEVVEAKQVTNAEPCVSFSIPSRELERRESTIDFRFQRENRAVYTEGGRVSLFLDDADALESSIDSEGCAHFTSLPTSVLEYVAAPTKGACQWGQVQIVRDVVKQCENIKVRSGSVLTLSVSCEAPAAGQSVIVDLFARNSNGVASHAVQSMAMPLNSTHRFAALIQGDVIVSARSTGSPKYVSVKRVNVDHDAHVEVHLLQVARVALKWPWQACTRLEVINEDGVDMALPRGIFRREWARLGIPLSLPVGRYVALAASESGQEVSRTLTVLEPNVRIEVDLFGSEQ